MFDMFGNHLNCTVAHNLILKTQLANNKCLLSVGKKEYYWKRGWGGELDPRRVLSRVWDGGGASVNVEGSFL